VAVSHGPVGADIERVTARHGLADLIATRFGPDEARCIESGCGGSALRSFYRHWTAKEAYLKASGRGLAGLRDTWLDCGSSPVIRFGGRPAAAWTLSLTDVAPAHAAAIVASQPVTKCWQLAPQPEQASRARPA
jgi:4'-phosphopantetheinyl transferase